MHRVSRIGFTMYLRVFLCAPLLILATVLLPHGTSALGTVTVTGVAADQSAVKIDFAPVPGAADYRVYDVADPSVVKYAGLVHLAADAGCPGSSCQHHFLTGAQGTPVFPYQVTAGATGGPQVLDTPATEIDWNNAGDGKPHTLIVQAVDQLGPVPKSSLYDAGNTPLAPGGMVGTDQGPTADGKISTNGQGPYTDSPHVLAQSAPFTVRVNPRHRAIPSSPRVLSSFFDTFPNAEASTLVRTARTDDYDRHGNLGSMSYTLNHGTPKAWTLEFRQTDNAHTMPMIKGDHFMDTLFDGATPGNIHGAPLHTIYGSMSMSPVRTADMRHGNVVHVTMEVDGHSSFRRWMGIDLAPAHDPLFSWDPDAGRPINHADRAVFLEFKPVGGCTLDIFTGPTSATSRRATGTAGNSPYQQDGARIWGLAGSSGGAPVMCWNSSPIDLSRGSVYKPSGTGLWDGFGDNGLGLDDKVRYDFYISQTHAALFINGRLVIQSNIPRGSFPWANGPVKVYFSHYLYHSAADVADVTNYLCFPMNAYWFNDPVNGTRSGQTQCGQAYPSGFGFQHSDERHWDNMGFEVLPSSAMPKNWGSLASSLAPPPVVHPARATTPAARTG